MMCLGYDMTDSPTALSIDRSVYNENAIAQYFIASFMNSVGQINGPNVPVWSSLSTGGEGLNGLKIEQSNVW
jgi:hypothetical protein